MVRTLPAHRILCGSVASTTVLAVMIALIALLTPGRAQQMSRSVADTAKGDVLGGSPSVHGHGPGRLPQRLDNPGSKAPQDDVGPLLFLFETIYESGGYAMSLATADVNGDGKTDLLVANCDTSGACLGEGSVGVLLSNGDGTLQSAVPYDSGGFAAKAVAVADVNGDGKPDLVVANCGSEFDCFGHGSVGVLMGNGDGTFQPAVTYDSGGNFAVSVAVADVNGDGKPDVMVLNTCSDAGGHNQCSQGVFSFSVLLGKGDGTFLAGTTYISDQPDGTSLVVADVNSDGKPDLLIGSATGINVLLGNGNGTFQSAVIYTVGHVVASVAVSDVNGDGKPDLLIANRSHGAGILLGNGDGTFQNVVTYDVHGQGPPGALAFAVTLADVNNDGKRDLLVGTSYGTSLLLGLGDGTFGSAVTYNIAVGWQASVAVADVNSDGKPDLFVADADVGRVGLLLNILELLPQPLQ